MEILTSDEIAALFGKNTVDSAEEVQKQEKTEEKTNDNATDDNGDNQSQESGGGDKGEDNTPEQKDAGVSPNFYTSIAKALKEEGVFPDLELDSVTDAASFRKMFETQSDRRLSVQQRRIIEALDNGAEPDEVKMYEDVLSFLFNLDVNKLSAEDKEGEKLRRELITRDLFNRGYSEDKVKRELEKSFSAGSDIEDAKEALQALKGYYHSGYENLRESMKKQTEAYRQKVQKEIDDMKNKLDSKETAFGSITLNKDLKRKIFNTAIKPVYKTPDGEVLTELQKYEKENHWDFVRYVSAFFTLTDGFTNFEKLFKPAAQKAVKEGFSQLEDVLKGDNIKDGSLKLLGGKGDGEYLAGKWRIDL